MRKIFFLIPIVIIIFSCNKTCVDNDINCTSTELSWLVYQGHETLFFRRNDGIFDTILVSGRGSYINMVQNCCGDKCDHHFQSVEINMGSNHYNYGSVYADIKIWHSNQWTGQLTPYIGMSIFDEGFLPLNVTPQNNIIVNGINYNNVYIVQEDTTQYNYTQPGPWRVYYTKSNGVIREDITNGKYWELVN